MVRERREALELGHQRQRVSRRLLFCGEDRHAGRGHRDFERLPRRFGERGQTLAGLRGSSERCERRRERARARRTSR